MAFLQMDYFSDALGMCTAVNVILPEASKSLIGMETNAYGTCKTMYLLHGLSDDQTIWMRRTSIERYAAERGLAVVMPAVTKSWYTDTAYGDNYLTFVAEELPRVCRSFFRGMSDKREDTFVAGLSMGGYGAAKIALTHPETFGGFASLSGCLNLFGHSRPMSPSMRGIFGCDLTDMAQLAGTDHDTVHLLETFAEKGFPFPKCYIWCGTGDHLLDSARVFKAKMDELGYSCTYQESEGDHSWHWWDMHIQDAMRVFLDD